MVVFTRVKRDIGALTERDLVDMLGPMDDGIIAAILHTGASMEEIEQASLWLDENHYAMSTTDRVMRERARRVYEILDYARHSAT